MKRFVVAFMLALSACAICDAQGIWKVRDVSAEGAFITDHQTLKLEAKRENGRDTCTVIDTTGGERAVTLAFCLPIDATDGTWCDDPQTSRRIAAPSTQPYANLTNRAGGLTDEASRYPFAVVIPAGSDRATVIACPPDVPRMVRFVYDANAKELRAEFDFGLSPIPERYRSRADAAVVTYDVPASWAFRRALAKYYALFPDTFKRRVTKAGTWLPFGESGPIKDAADFGFAFHEISDAQVDPRILSDDDKIGCGSYVYTEPQTYWQTYKGNGKGTYAERLAQLESDAKAGDAISQATLVSGVIRSTGKRDIYLEGVPYTPQLPWGNNPDPNLPAARGFANKGTYELDRLAPHVGWSDKPNPGTEGVYIDSMEGWCELHNYNHDHWRVTQFPLTFDPINHRKVSLLNFWGMYAFIREASTRAHAHNQLLFGNDAFYRRWQFAPWVDIPGREYTWTDAAGKLTPVADADFLFLRAMAGKKPYLMLMNNRYDVGSVMEPYMQRCLFYAVFPSAFMANQAMNEVAYFSNPDWYNRDRELFKMYIPMVRQLDEAGWEPVTLATVEPTSARVERYGSVAAKALAFTVHNPGSSTGDVTLTISRGDLQLPEHVIGKSGIRPDSVSIAESESEIRVTIHMPADSYEVIRLQPR